MSHTINQESLEHQAQRVLEWPALLDVLANHAQSSLGAERCRTLHLEDTLEAAQERLQETAEMVAILQSDQPLPICQFQDIRTVLNRSTKGGVLEGIDFYAVSKMLGIAHEVSRCLSHHHTKTPLLSQKHDTMNVPRELKDSIDQCVDTEGNVLETATPILRDLIEETHGLKHRIRRRLETIIKAQDLTDVLQERYFIQRGSRYVLPIRTDMQSKLPGIVHDVSASGATVFIEPRELIELNNHIKRTELEIAREIKRILTELSALVASCHLEILSLLDILAELDCLGAKARLSQMMNGHCLDLNNEGRIMLRGACHPLLVTVKDHVIPHVSFPVKRTGST
ncbi:MAG: hypothetical protein GKS05_12480 [Nitrospirales bacterium]|nr:hypothetical protein [Nitrospirales bacterium]